MSVCANRQRTSWEHFYGRLLKMESMRLEFYATNGKMGWLLLLIQDHNMHWEKWVVFFAILNPIGKQDNSRLFNVYR